MIRYVVLCPVVRVAVLRISTTSLGGRKEIVE